jgi:GNAT superfamily N-acetyltransferase
VPAGRTSRSASGDVRIACQDGPVTTPAPDAGVRAARPADAAALGRVHARAWAAAYRDLLPAVADEAQLADAWTAAVVAPPSAHHRVLVATAGEHVVGFAALAPSPDADAAQGPGTDAELLVLLVDPDAVGHGHGSRLLNAGADVLADSGARRLRTWVPEPDVERQRFLAGAGFAADGATRVLDATGDGSTTLREIRMTVALPERP